MRRLLVIIAVVLLASQAQAGLAMRGLAAVRANMSSIPRDGLVAEYLFTSDARDTSGNGYNGSLQGGAASTNGLLILDGINDFVLFTNTVVPMGAQSVSVWCRYDTSVLSQQQILGTTFNTAWKGLRFGHYNDNLSVSVSDGASRWEASSYGPEITNTGWAHYVLTWDGTTNANSYIVYADLVPRFKTPIGTQTGAPDNPFMIGRASPLTEGGNYFKGAMDNVRVYNRSLTSTEVDTLYKEGHD